MRIFRIIFTTILVTACISVNAGDQSVYIDHYGVVDELYVDEKRVIIDDQNLNYNQMSIFYNARGRVVRGIKSILKPGVAVKYHYYQESEEMLLKDVKVISVREYEKSIKKASEEEY